MGMRFLLAALAFCLLGPLAASQEGLARFEAEHGPGWTVWNGPGGAPYRVFGPGAQVLPGGVRDLAQARAAARLLLERHGSWLGLAPEEAEEHHAAEGRNLVVVELQQHHRGVPVRDAFVQFLFNRNDGGLAMLGSEAIPGLDVPVLPALTAAAALARFRESTGWSEDRGRLQRPPALEIVPDRESGWRLAWRIAAELEQEPVGWILWIDARDGRVLDQESAIHNQGPGLSGTVKGMASKPPGGDTPANPPQPLPLPGVKIDVPGVGSAYTDANGSFFIPYAGTGTFNITVSLAAGRYWSSLTDSAGAPIQSLGAKLDPAAPASLLFNPAPSEYLTAQVNGVKWATEIHDYLKRVVPGMTAIDQPIKVRVNYNSSCNAFYGSGQITFYRKAGSCYNTANASVVAHEYGHYMDDRNGGIGSTPRTPSEGIADACTIFLLDDPVIGRDFYLTGGGIRDARNTLTHPLTGTTQAVHTFGQPYMGFCWDFLQNCVAAYGKTAGYAFAEQAVFESVLANPRDMLDYLLKLYLADDDDSSLDNGTPRIVELAQAAWKRHFVRPAFQAIVIDHTPLADAADGAAGFAVQAKVKCHKGSLTGVDLWFDDGLGTFNRIACAPAGGSWVAATGPVAQGKAARYYLEARSDLGGYVRLPAEAGDAFVFAVGHKWMVLRDGFEAATTNFTASNGTSAAGWSRHIPFGRNYDPPAAAAGSYVWGVNRSTTDERFATTAATVTLTSRALDTRGLKGLRLRFRRWLTADANSTGRVLVGSTAVQTATATGDQAWRTYDLDIAALADNRAAVTVAFQLQHSGSDGVGGFTLDDVELYALATTVPGSFAYFGAGCPGTPGTPSLAAVGVPVAGQGFTVDLSGAPAGAPAFLLTGLSNSAWGPYTLPFPLDGIGAPGCAILVSPELVAGVIAGATGAAPVLIQVPDVPALVGARFCQQFLVLDAQANRLGLTATRGGEGRVGS